MCINERLGTGQRSCIGSGNRDYIEAMRGLLADAGLDIKIVERECLGKCEIGPIMRIAPAGKFFTNIDQQTLPLIVDEIIKFIAAEKEC